MKTFRC